MGDRDRITRRDVLRRGVSLGLGLPSLAALVAACSAEAPTGGAERTSASASGFPWDDQEVAGRLDFANWPYYIDAKQGERPSLEAFTKETGIEINYKPVINGNAQFFASIEPALSAGDPTGWDLMILTGGSPEVAKLIEFEWLTPLDLELLPNYTSGASDLVKAPPWDPENRYTIAYQSFLTGIGYAPEAVEALGHEPTSFQDLLSPALEGKVGMMSDIIELGCAGILAVGADPGSSTPDDWVDAAAFLQEQKDMGLVRNYYDQGYINALQNRDVWITQAWSTDVFQSQQSGYPELEFLVPDEGVILGTDNFMIPAGAEHPLDAVMLIDFFYRPDIAAGLADYLQAICPVPAAADIIAEELGHPEIAQSPLVFPGPDVAEKARTYYTFRSGEDLQQWNDTFRPIVIS
jgi:spermidine/putrescine transport system substrate-binding protein